MHKGFFITVEGIDGIGKTTQLNMLLRALREQAPHGVYFTKEPGDGTFGSNIGTGIRNIVFKNPGTQNLGPGVGDLLFLADHVQNVHDIRKVLATGQIVVSDRYADSQFAYSAHPSKKSPAWANRYFAEQYGVMPDLTLLMFARGDKTDQPGVSVDERGRTGRYLNEPVEDISWALSRANARRGAEAGKQEGKAWNDVSAQMKIQDAYFEALKTENRTRLIEVWEADSPEQIHTKIMDEVNLALTSHIANKQFSLPLVETVIEAA